MNHFKLIIFLILPLLYQYSHAASPDYDDLSNVGDLLYCFYNNSHEASVAGVYSDATTIKIPSKVTFNDTEYTVTSIRERAFWYNETIKSITFPSSVTTIGNSAFEYSDISSFTLSSGLITIGKSAFQACENLSTITLPSTLQNIGDYAFAECIKLTSISIPQSVISMGTGVFAGCEKIKTARFNNSLEKIEDYFFEDCDVLYSVTFPKELKQIGDRVFMNCKSLTSITLPNTLEEIGEYAFYQCGLSSLTIPKTVLKIKDYAFAENANLKTITFSDGEKNLDLGNNVFYSYDKILTKIILGRNISKTGLFKYQDNLSTLTISNTVTSIPAQSFMGCSSLTKLTIPNSVVQIDKEAFAYCDQLKNIIFSDGTEDLILKENVFGASYLSKVITTVSIGRNIICEDLFINQKNLTTVTISSKVSFLPKGMFKNCTQITKISLPSSIKTIYPEVFYECTSLTNLGTSCQIDTVGYSAFYNCSSLTNIGSSSKLKAIGVQAFYGCESLTSINFSNEIEKIHEGSFYNCKKLITNSLPDSLKEIDNEAFYNCTLINFKELPSELTKIGDKAFARCENISCGLLPKSLSYIGKEAFYNSSITEVTIPSTINSIPSYCFYGCNINNLIINNGVIEIADNAFSTVKNTVVLPPSISKLGSNFSYVKNNIIIFNGNINIDISSSASNYYILDNNTPRITGSHLSSSFYVFDKISFLRETGLKEQVVHELSEDIKCPSLKYIGKLQGPNRNTVKWPLGENLKNWGIDYEFQGCENIDCGIWEGEEEIIYKYSDWQISSKIKYNYEITQAPLTLKIEENKRYYGEEEPKFKYILEGLVGKDTEKESVIEDITFNPDCTIKSDVGVYSVNASAKAKNYIVNIIPGKLIIEQAPLTVRVNNITRPYNENNPEFTMSYIGMKNGETEEVFIQKPLTNCTASIKSEPGDYPINVSEGEAKNYKFIEYFPGILTIRKADQKIIWDQNLSSVLIGEKIYLEAESSANLPVSFETLNQFVDLNYKEGKWYLSCNTPEIIEVTATQDGNKYYNEAPKMSRLITIHSEIIEVADISISPKVSKIGSGKVLVLKALISPENATDKSVVWSSSDNDVAIVHEGVVTGINPGLVSITATSANGMTASAAVTVIKSDSQENPDCPLYNQEFYKDNLIYRIISNEDVAIIGTNLSEESYLTIPEVVEYNSTTYNVKIIENEAFNNNPFLISISIPTSVKKIGNDVFNGCFQLKEFIVDYSEEDIILGYNSKLNYSTSITPFPDPSSSLERKIGYRNCYYNGLFYGLPLERVEINRNIKLENYYCRRTGEPNDIYDLIYNDIIYYSPFYGLNTLKEIEIGSNVKNICEDRINVIQNAKENEIQYQTFGQCDNIDLVTSKCSIAPIGGGFSQRTYENTILLLSNGGQETYDNNEYWKRFNHVVEWEYIPLKSLNIMTSDLTINPTISRSLDIEFYPPNASFQNFKWESSDESIVEVNREGYISGLKEGTCIIKVSADDTSNLSDECIIKVVSESGINVIEYYYDEIISIYTLDGKLIKRRCDIAELKKLSKGIYIVNSSKGAFKISL